MTGIRTDAAAAAAQRLSDSRLRPCSPDLRAIVGELGDRYTPSARYRALVATLGSCRDPRAVAGIVAPDAALSARLLAVARLPVFGGVETVCSLEAALARLGPEPVKALATEQDIVAQMRERPIWDHFIRATAAHGDGVAGMALDFLRRAGRAPAMLQAGFAAGLLHDIGTLVLADAVGDRYRILLHRAGAELDIAERAILGIDHGAVGAHILGLWGIAPLVVDAVARHHDSFPADRGPLTLPRAVAAANMVARNRLHRDMRLGPVAAPPRC